MRVPEDATVDPDAAADALGGDEFVMDVQTHFLEYDLSTPSGDFASASRSRRAAKTDAAALLLDRPLPRGGVPPVATPTSRW